MATIDSPSAMMTISPWRSAKWPGTSFHPSDPNTYGSPMSSASASAHNAPCAGPSRNAAAVMSATPIAVPANRPSVERRSAGSPRAATSSSAIWANRTIPYATASSSAESSNASGMHRAMTSSPIIAPNIAIRTTPSSGSTTLVSHA
jgi:hypothetical protein